MSEIKLESTVERPSDAQLARALMTKAFFYYVSETRINYVMIDDIYDDFVNTASTFGVSTLDYPECVHNIETLGCIILCSEIAMKHCLNQPFDPLDWYEYLSTGVELDESEYELDDTNEPFELVEMLARIDAELNQEISAFGLFRATCYKVTTMIKSPEVWSAIEHLADRLETEERLSGEEIEEYLYKNFGDPFFLQFEPSVELWPHDWISK